MFLSLRGMMSMTERRGSCPAGFVASIMAMSYKKRVKDTTVSYGPGDVALPSIMGENTHVGLQVPYIFLERGGERQKSHGKHKALRKGIPHVTSIASLYTWRKTCHRKTKTHATHSHIYLQHPPFIISLCTPPCPTPSKQGSRHPKLHHLVQSLIPPMLQQKPKPIYPNSTNDFASPPK